MDIEVRDDGEFGIRLTFDRDEVRLLGVALERACYLDTQPEDLAPSLHFAEVLLRQLRRALPGPESAAGG